MDDGTSFGQFSYGKEGIIKIEDAGTTQGEDGKEEPVYKIEFNLTSKDGFTLKGSYTGVIPITDASDDKSDDDGTSTLERDYDMDLSKIKRRITILRIRSISKASATNRSVPTDAVCNSSISVSNG